MIPRFRLPSPVTLIVRRKGYEYRSTILCRHSSAAELPTASVSCPGRIDLLDGRQLTLVAAPLQVYQITGSTLAVGLLGLVQLPMLIIGSFLGGSLADSYDRRKLLLMANVALAVISAGLAVNASLGSPVTWLVYALDFGERFPERHRLSGSKFVDSPSGWRSISSRRHMPSGS